jgi:uncharacterized coiled-coil DUF342 family protein
MTINITPDMSPEQVKEALTALKALKASQRDARKAKRESNRPAQITKLQSRINDLKFKASKLQKKLDTLTGASVTA